MNGFRDRSDAGRALAAGLRSYRADRPVDHVCQDWEESSGEPIPPFSS
jgi:hypothetical protein